jgi:hypothetical protein
MSNLNELLQNLMTVISGVAEQVQTEATSAAPDLYVDDTDSIYESSYQIILQGRVKSPSPETVRGLVAGSGSFQGLLDTVFAGSDTTRISSVTVIAEDDFYNECFNLHDRIPGSVLDLGGVVKFNYAVESGVNG